MKGWTSTWRLRAGSAALVFACTVIAACSTLGMAGAYALSKKGPMDGDPVTGRLAIMYPEHIDSVGLFVFFTVTQNAEVVREQTFLLDVDGTAMPAIKRPDTAGGGTIAVHTVKADQIDAAREFQRYLDSTVYNAAENQDAPYSLSLRFLPLLGATSEAAFKYCEPNVKAPFYVWYKLDDASPYKRIIRTRSIDKAMRDMTAHLCEITKRGSAAKELQNP